MSRSQWMIATFVATAGVALSTFVATPTRLVWNASASAPIGLYMVSPVDQLTPSELVAVDPPEPLASFLADGGYLPRGVPLLKRVVALPGQRVCRHDLTITVDGAAIGAALARDRIGRPLPAWRGCRMIAEGEAFLMNGSVRDSLDGRYFGPIPTSAVIGRATPLYTDEGGDGRFEWRAATR
jgi:conjugative transfer signal peptidase TraF